MLTISRWRNLSKEEQQQKLSRPKISESFKTQVQAIIEAVRLNGDKALYDFTREYDDVSLESLQIPSSKIQNATIPEQSLIALKEAINTIRTYHQATKPEGKLVTTATGITIEQCYRPISRVGLYIPGGNQTPLVSSLLMQAIPAQVAGCAIRVLCTPPNAQGEIDPHLLVAARLCNIEIIFPLGGAQAIAAMAYGTESITKVDKIFGPGNSFVTEAKTQVAADPEGASIDMPAGPSELMILADDLANPNFVAADLLAQAEHGIDSQVILICETEDFAKKVKQSLKEQFCGLSRKSILEKSLALGSILISDNLEEQLNLINWYAPEHLIINRKDAKNLVPQIQAAGTVFLGQWAAETMGDYVSGSNHVLPTNGYAKSVNGLGIADFLKCFSVQTISEEGVKSLGPSAQILALIEGLDGHAEAIKLRLNELNSMGENDVCFRTYST